MPKEVWTCDEHGIDFENEDDYNAYMHQMWQKEEEEQRRREDEEWIEEYYRRRRDPYWKNDSDYD